MMGGKGYQECSARTDGKTQVRGRAGWEGGGQLHPQAPHQLAPRWPGLPHNP